MTKNSTKFLSPCQSLPYVCDLVDDVVNLDIFNMMWLKMSLYHLIILSDSRNLLFSMNDTRIKRAKGKNIYVGVGAKKD